MMDDLVLTGLLETLDFVVLEWTGGRAFRLLGKLPGWFESLPICLKPPPEPFYLDDEIPFLEHFLVDAEKFWQQGNEKWIKSGPWVETNREGHEYALEATAVSIGDHKLLLIQLGLSQFVEKQEIIQYGRELSLEYRRLQHWEKDLVARQQQLEDLISARTRELSESNESLRKENAARKNAEEVLRREEEKFRTLIEQCPFGVVWKEQGLPKYVNPAFTAIFACRLDDLQSGVWSADFLRSAESFSFLQGRAEPPGEAPAYAHPPVTSKILTKERVEKIIRSQSVTFGPNNEFLFLEDVTEQKRMEDHLAQAQKMEVAGTLAGGVAHDFNNLLQLIRGYAELLQIRGVGKGAECPELQEIIDASTRGNDLTRQLLTVSRRLETPQRALDLNEVVQKTYPLLGKTFPQMIEVKLSLAPDLGLVNGDQTQLEQVLVNLAINARDAMPEGGLLTISTSNFRLTPEESGSLPGLGPGEYVVLRVTDTGTGMDEETQQRMFEPFFTTKGIGKGVGLGLAMVYGITKSHHASIFCDSKPGEGTSFRICFPRSHDQVQRVPSARSVVPGGSERILLVEDEQSLRRQGEEIMGSFGYTVISEPNAERALQRFAKEYQSIDLVVLDLIMPGMSGQKCLAEMLKIDPKARIVITSGLAHAKNRAELQAAKGFVAKPYSVGVFLQAIRAALDEA